MHEIPIADATNMQSARHFVSSSPCLLVSCLALLLLPDPWLMLAQRRAPSTQIRPSSRTAPERNPERTGDDMAGILISLCCSCARTGRNTRGAQPWKSAKYELA
jgi:hypothetical protein